MVFSAKRGDAGGGEAEGPPGVRERYGGNQVPHGVAPIKLGKGHR